MRQQANKNENRETRVRDASLHLSWYLTNSLNNLLEILSLARLLRLVFLWLYHAIKKIFFFCASQPAPHLILMDSYSYTYVQLLPSTSFHDFSLCLWLSGLVLRREGEWKPAIYTSFKNVAWQTSTHLRCLYAYTQPSAFWLPLHTLALTEIINGFACWTLIAVCSVGFKKFFSSCSTEDSIFSKKNFFPHREITFILA